MRFLDGDLLDGNLLFDIDLFLENVDLLDADLLDADLPLDADLLDADLPLLPPQNPGGEVGDPSASCCRNETGPCLDISPCAGCC